MKSCPTFDESLFGRHNGIIMQHSNKQHRRRVSFWQYGRGVYLLPNLLTSFALFSSFYAIIAAMKGRFEPAAIAIYVAMLMDSLDGRIARLTNTQTAFGAQYDSLADMMSFGLAPALLAYCWGLNQLGKIGWLICFAYVASVGLRLAWFNIQSSEVACRYFRGMPCTACAGILAGAVWVFENYHWKHTLAFIVLAFILGLLAILMMSRLRYYSFKDIDLRGKVPFVYALIIILLLVLVAFDPPELLLSMFVIYACFGPALVLWRAIAKCRRKHVN